MGIAIKWFNGLFGRKKDKAKTESPNSGDRKDKKRWALGLSGRGSTASGQNPATTPPNITSAEATWLKSCYINESEKDQNKHAIAVAVATAAAADAAVAAAQAAVAVVRLTSRGRDSGFGGGRERWAAIKIQSIFRRYLSRKALRALKGLVKLQALVRGYLVRQQATATLHSMQALIRAQAIVRAQKTRGFVKNGDGFHSQYRTRKSIERFDDTRSENTTSFHNRRLSASFESTTLNAIDESPKIVEMDPGRPKSKSRRTNTWVTDSCDNPYSQTHSSPFPCRIPARLSIPDRRNFHNSDWGITGDECRFSTAQSTPRIANSCGSNAPATPAKSVCVDNILGHYSIYPNYMASTQSFKAKLRSQSAPKQRPETGLKKKLSLNELMESRNSLSGVKMQRSCSQAQEVTSFKNAVMGNLNRPLGFVREAERDYFMEGKW